MKPTLRAITSADGDEISKLSLAAPDAGRVQFAVSYRGDAWCALQRLRSETAGIAAVDRNRLTGAAFLSLGQCTIDGHERDYALVHTVMVDPATRGRGIATALLEACRDLARERIGRSGVILANVQEGNVASEKAFTRILTPGTRLFVAPIPLRHPWFSSSRRRQDIVVRPAEPRDLAGFASGLASMLGSHDYFRPETEGSLRRWSEAQEQTQQFRRLYVAERGGRLLAGAGVVAQFMVRTLILRRAPRWYRAVAHLMGAVSGEGVARQIAVEKAWCEPGRAEVGRFLLRAIGATWRDKADIATFSYHEQSPLRAMSPLPAWWPITTIRLFHSLPELSPGARPVCHIS